MSYTKTRLGCNDAFATRALLALAFFATFALSACGGGSDDRAVGVAPKNAGQSVSLTPTSNAKTVTLQQEGARLNKEELEQIAKTGVLPKPFDGPLLSGAAGSTKATLNKFAESTAEIKSFGESKSAASRTAVYRFYNTQTSAHFFTTSTTERDNVRATFSHMTYEGPAFYASGTTVPGLSPVHRFYNTSTGVHFYTISETERAHVAATLPQFNYEGIAYYASTLPGTGYTPLYRFFYAARGFHFYTNSAAEKDNIIATLPQYSFEGVGYYVLGSDWQTPTIPHSGVTSSQCYQVGSDALVSCASAGAIALNPQQDGHRTAINPMSYSDVLSGYIGTFPFAIALYYPKTSCVRDNVTGLIWEGKEASGSRSSANYYTNHGDSRAGDAGAYVNTVNALNLCGFNDWRLPKAEELQGLLLLGKATSRFDSDFFPNTIAGEYWTSTADVDNTAKAWRVQFGSGVVYPNDRIRTTSVRLVRGSEWAGPRYLITSAAYGTDSAGNAVIDRWTGLTWRRCLQGSNWSGSGCVAGASSTFSHEEALLQPNGHSGWRLPNVKELASLVKYERVGEKLDPDYFPSGQGVPIWSSTPNLFTTFGNDGYEVDFLTGRSWTRSRGEAKGVRLVWVHP